MQSVSVVTDRSITMSFALIVPDAVFDHYTQGDYDVYLDGVLAPSMTEGKSLMNAIADMNALLDPLGLKYESYLQNLGRELFYIVAASYLTIYLAIIFLVVANTIIGVQFLMGQQRPRAATGRSCVSVRSTTRSAARQRRRSTGILVCRSAWRQSAVCLACARSSPVCSPHRRSAA